MRYFVARAGEVSLEVFDLLGRRVRRFSADPARSGPHELVWDGQDEAGRKVGSGIYVIRLHTLAQSISRKVMLMR